MRISNQQRAVLGALEIARTPVPTTILRDVRSALRPWNHDDTTTYRIGEPVGSVLRRLRSRGLVRSVGGRDALDWSITPLGREVLRGLPQQERSR